MTKKTKRTLRPSTCVTEKALANVRGGSDSVNYCVPQIGGSQTNSMTLSFDAK